MNFIHNCCLVLNPERNLQFLFFIHIPHQGHLSTVSTLLAKYVQNLITLQHLPTNLIQDIISFHLDYYEYLTFFFLCSLLSHNSQSNIRKTWNRSCHYFTENHPMAGFFLSSGMKSKNFPIVYKSFVILLPCRFVYDLISNFSILSFYCSYFGLLDESLCCCSLWFEHKLPNIWVVGSLI